MERLPEIASIKPLNPNKLVRENREKINEIVVYITSQERSKDAVDQTKH